MTRRRDRSSKQFYTQTMEGPHTMEAFCTAVLGQWERHYTWHGTVFSISKPFKSYDISIFIN